MSWVSNPNILSCWKFSGIVICEGRVKRGGGGVGGEGRQDDHCAACDMDTAYWSQSRI